MQPLHATKMQILKKLHPQYMTDEKGNKLSVVLSIQGFEELLENLEDLAAIAERREEPTVSHHDFLMELKQNGLI